MTVLFQQLFFSLSVLLAVLSNAFVQQQQPSRRAFVRELHIFDKLFEEQGMLGKGITVGKVQVALMSVDRSKDSIFGLLQSKAANSGDSPQELARLANDVCLALLRKSDDWVAACSASKWFKFDDAGKAEAYYNDIANAEALKYEKVGN
jgi:hypothetical protein